MALAVIAAAFAVSFGLAEPPGESVNEAWDRLDRESEVPTQRPSGVLRVVAAPETVVSRAELTTAAGQLFTCGEAITYGSPCTLRDVPPGAANLTVTVGASIQTYAINILALELTGPFLVDGRDMGSGARPTNPSNPALLLVLSGVGATLAGIATVAAAGHIRRHHVPPVDCDPPAGEPMPKGCSEHGDPQGFPFAFPGMLLLYAIGVPLTVSGFVFTLFSVERWTEASQALTPAASKKGQHGLYLSFTVSF